MRAVYEKIIPLKAGCCYLSCSETETGKANLLFIHGLGESGLSFTEAFAADKLEGFNLYIPDLLGCGRSTFAADRTYTMEAQAARLRELMDALELETCYLIGHSMGGDIASLMAYTDGVQRVGGIVNIEGNLTPEDLFISSRAWHALRRGCFATWFESEFKYNTVLKNWGSRWASCRRYFASLEFCRPGVFAACAREIVERNRPAAGGQGSAAGHIYAALRIPKVFCWGSESLSQESRDFLAKRSLYHKEFTQAFHWPMIDRPVQFYAFVADFISGIEKGKSKDDKSG